jgi:hypothetical protein
MLLHDPQNTRPQHRQWCLRSRMENASPQPAHHRAVSSRCQARRLRMPSLTKSRPGEPARERGLLLLLLRWWERKEEEEDEDEDEEEEVEIDGVDGVIECAVEVDAMLESMSLSGEGRIWAATALSDAAGRLAQEGVVLLPFPVVEKEEEEGVAAPAELAEDEALVSSEGDMEVAVVAAAAGDAPLVCPPPPPPPPPPSRRAATSAAVLCVALRRSDERLPCLERDAARARRGVSQMVL